MDLDITQPYEHDTSHRPRSHNSGAETPKELTSRLKILELFTLHVLPRNDEWEYARSFISMSDILDDDRREAFLQSLQELQDVKEREVRKELAILQQERDAQLQEALADKNQAEAESASSRRRVLEQNGPVHRRTSSEVDYGIEKKGLNGNVVPPPKTQKSVTPSSAGSADTTKGLHFPPPSEASRRRKMSKSSQQRHTAYFQHVRNVFRVMQDLVRSMATSIGANPTILLKMLISVLAIIMALSRRDIRERTKRILGNGWDKVRNTVGMGVKVSYI
jgi:hypothetical protein